MINTQRRRKNVFLIIAAVLCLGIAAITVCLFTGVFLKKDTADPLFTEGAVSIRMPGDEEWTPLTESSIIIEGCEIMTGEESSLELGLPGDSIIKVGENSHVRFNTLGSIEVTKIARTDIDILYGKMRAFVAPFRDNTSRFTIRTGKASIGVRGTDFGVIASRDEGTAEILCLDGEVLVSAEDETTGWEPVVVAANREVTLTEGMPAGEPTPLDDEKREAFLADMALESLGETESNTDDIPVESTPEKDITFHEVKPGDTLWDLAAQYYGDAGEYPVLLNANRDVISDKDIIYPGQVLQIP